MLSLIDPTWRDLEGGYRIPYGAAIEFLGRGYDEIAS
jgi:hypothetical protein